MLYVLRIGKKTRSFQVVKTGYSVIGEGEQAYELWARVVEQPISKLDYPVEEKVLILYKGELKKVKLLYELIGKKEEISSPEVFEELVTVVENNFCD